MIIHSQVQEAQPIRLMLRTSTGVEARLEVSSTLLTLDDAGINLGAQDELTGSIELLHHPPHITPPPHCQTWDQLY